ncbi:uncharacterized protein NP_6136A (plasmid) [Natronomonas pharaonis DSM 2160]|uniref:Uncharacterized protein n=1 Tax=Natronomonas pharaonis (strain ATCC 35678 / DSM 2160 / CIP 103997 / JCM 8858 / NBRC 14720 / NCIMB 2260 / Gabara) TaxID=348780 RepID=Q3IM19_NATPD|nr:hypothetical protein [Natronomonas pharaonis]CAI50848.1 uncharacterized protein NP_6136A [Natronomonas pharaonis DSM 2160]
MTETERNVGELTDEELLAEYKSTVAFRRQEREWGEIAPELDMKIQAIEEEILERMG